MSTTPQAPQRVMIPTPFTENGVPVQLEALVRKPAGPGPHPVLLFNHGSTGNGRNPRAFRLTHDYPSTARFFNERGWMTVFLHRRGRGRSGGRYDEGIGPDRKLGYSCEPDIALAGLARAMDDVDAAFAYLSSQSDVRVDRVLIGGVSCGGILSIACAGRWPDRFVGAINFVGGWLGRACPSHEQVNPQIFARGARFAGLTLWLHGSRDLYYRIAHCRINFQAFQAAGGRGSFHALPAGHALIAKPGLWHPLVDAFLQSLAAAHATPATIGGDMRPPAP